jgi:hypothetical protein
MFVLPPEADVVRLRAQARLVPTAFIGHCSKRDRNQLLDQRAAADRECDVLLATGHIGDRGAGRVNITANRSSYRLSISLSGIVLPNSFLLASDLPASYFTATIRTPPSLRC